MSGYESLRSDAAWLDLSNRAKIRVTGEDRARLLHAMSTNHVEGLAAGRGLYTFFLNSQGRILADAYVYNLGEALLLDTEPELRDKLRDHLDRYIIADDAYLADETETWAVVAIEGPNSVTRATAAGLPVPEVKYGVLTWQDGFVAKVASTGAEGVRVFVPIQSKAAVVELLRSAGLVEATSQEASIVRLENGIPRYGDDITERYLVQETGVLHAVHANKGCYLGQEIVERVRSRAQIHRHLKSIRVHGDVPPAPGAKLMAGEQPAGEITSAAYSPALREVAAMAYLRTEATTNALPMTLADAEPPITAEAV